MSPQPNYTLDDINALIARRQLARQGGVGASDDGIPSWAASRIANSETSPQSSTPCAPVPAVTPSMDTAAPFSGVTVPDWAARRIQGASNLVLDTTKPQPAPINLVLDMTKPQPAPQLLSTSDGDEASPAGTNGQDHGQTLTDYGVTLRKALDRTGAAMGYGLKKIAPVAFGGYAGAVGEAGGQAVRDYYHGREDTAPQQSESFKSQEAMPWSEAIKHPITAAGKLAGEALSAAPDMALATAATMATGGTDLPGIVKAVVGGTAGGTAFGLGAAERASYEIEKMPEDKLRATPAFQDAYAETDPSLPESDRVAQARKNAADATAAATFGANATVGGVTGGTLGPAAGILKKWAPGLVSSIVAGAGEGAGFMGGQTVADNAIRRANVDPNISLTEGLPDAMIGGALFGGTHAALKGSPIDTKARTQFVDAMGKDLESGAISTYTPEELAKTTQAANQFYQTDPDNRTLYRGVLELDQEAKRRANQPEGVPFGPEQPAETQPPQFTRQGLAKLAMGDLDTQDRLMSIADVYGIKEPHRMAPGDLVDSIMSAQEARVSEIRRRREAARAAAEMQAQAEQARKDILAAQDETGRLDAIKRFEEATTSLAQTPALPAGTQDFSLVGEPTPTAMTAAQRDQMARSVMQPQPEWEIPGPEPQTERGMFDRENEDAFGGSIPYQVPEPAATPPMDLGARRYLETRAQGLDATINESSRTGAESDAKAVAEREAIGRMLSEDDAARAIARQAQETSQAAQEGGQAVLPGDSGNKSRQTPNVPQEAARAVPAQRPATPEEFAREYGIPATPEFLDAIQMYQEITGEKMAGATRGLAEEEVFTPSSATREPISSPYFKDDPRARALPLDTLIAREPADPKRVARSLAYMDAAKKGFGEKRNPIDVIDRGDGTFKVLDGNTTLESLKQLGEKDAVVRVRKTLKQRGVENWDDLYAQANEAQPMLEKMTQEWASELGGGVQMRPGLKKQERAQRKVDAGDSTIDSLKDITASTIVFNSEDQVRAALEKIKAEHPEVMRIKDRYARPGVDGYSDVLLNVRLPNGHIAEMQLNTKAMLEAKSGLGHDIYELKDAVDNQTTPQNKAASTDIVNLLDDASREIYTAARRSASSSAYSSENSKASSREIGVPDEQTLVKLENVLGNNSSILSPIIRNNLRSFLSKAKALSSHSKYSSDMGTPPISKQNIRQNGQGSKLGPGLFKKQTSDSSWGVPASTVESWLAPVRERLASHINLKVANSPDDIPASDRARLAAQDPNWMQNSTGAATKDGSYLLAWNLKGDKNEVRALATHEVKHQAMYRIFERLAQEKPYKGMATQQMARVLNPLIDARQGEIESLMRSQYGQGFDSSNRLHMLIGASEWLADAKNLEPRLYEKFMAAVRAALRAVGEKLNIYWLKGMKMSDAEIKAFNARVMREALHPAASASEMPSFAGMTERQAAITGSAPAVLASGDLAAAFRRGTAPPPAHAAPIFEDPAVEARFREAAKGIGDQRGILERGKDWLGEQAAGFTRHFIHMPNTPQYAEAHEALRQLEAAPTAAKEEAVRNLRTVTGKLSPGAYDLFTRKVVLDDLAHEASLGHDLPFGFTPEAMAKEKAKVDRWAENVPEVKDALATRKTIMDNLTGKLVDAGILSEDQVKNPAYFRHEVLKYAREWQNSQGTGSALKKPKPGYAKGREGSTEDISANYLEAEYAFMQRAAVDLKTAETLKKIQGKYDVMPQVKTAAQEANTRALAAMGMDATRMTEGQKKEALGAKYKTWGSMIPEGYDRFQADKGLVYHTGNSITDKAMLSLMDTLQMDDKAFQAQAPEVVLDVLNGVRQQLMVGGKKPEMILPKPIVETLNNLRPKAERSFFDQALSKPLGMWKQWVLINPRRVLKYNLNNMAGDLDAVIAGNPKTLSKLPEAIRELRDVMKGGDPSQDYKDAVARGVFDSGLSVQEIPDVAKLDAFQNLMAERSGKFSPMDVVRKGWRTLQDYTQFRENWMRLAAYKDYLRRIEAGEDMRSIGYGAADPKIVDALSDSKDRAAMLARTLVGDYGAVSHYGQGLRNKVIPFYSWMEVNAKRYGQLIKNAFDQGIGQGFKTAGLTGAALGTRASVYLGLRMAAMYGLISAYNHLFHKDEEETLSPLDQQQLHVILGRDKGGNVHTLRLQGALSDFLGWFGFSDAVGAMKEIQNGRGSYADVLKAVAKAPVNKVASGLSPFLKTPLELAMGQSTYPDVFNPRPMQDRAREAARLFSAENEYDALRDKPTRGYWQSWLQAVDYSRNVGEIAFNNTMDRIRDFKESKGIEGAGTSSTPKSRVIREYKQAIRYGDAKAAQAAMEKMRAQGVTSDDMEKSLIRSAPLAGLARKDRAEFLATLTPKEQDQVKAAEDWYKDTFLDSDELKTKYDFHEMEADYNLLDKQRKELLKAGRFAVAQDLAMKNSLGRKRELITFVNRLKAGRKKVLEATMLPDEEKAARLKEYDKRILDAMGRTLSSTGVVPMVGND